MCFCINLKSSTHQNTQHEGKQGQHNQSELQNDKWYEERYVDHYQLLHIKWIVCVYLFLTNQILISVRRLKALKATKSVKMIITMSLYYVLTIK